VTAAIEPSTTPRPNSAGVDQHPATGTPAGIDHRHRIGDEAALGHTCQNCCNRSGRMKIE